MTIEATNRVIKDAKRLDPNKTYDITAEGFVERKDPMKEKWYKITEAAKEIGENPNSIANAIHRGYLNATLIPDSNKGHYLIGETDLIDWMTDKNKIRDQKRNDSYKEKYHALNTARKRSEGNAVVEIPKDEFGISMIDVNEIARRTGLRSTSVTNAINRGRLKASKHRAENMLKWYVAESDYNEWLNNTPHRKPNRTNNKEASVKEETKYTAVISIPTDKIKSINDIHGEIQKLVEYCYNLGFEDGKLSVEHDSQDEYRKGFEDGKKAKSEELLAMLKGV